MPRPRKKRRRGSRSRARPGNSSPGEPLYDAVILGGGLAGLTLARQLHREAPHLRVLVAEKTPHPVREAAFKVGESSVEIGAHYFQIGARPRAAPARRDSSRSSGCATSSRTAATATSPGGSSSARRTSRSVPSFQLDRGRLENLLLDDRARAGVEVLDGCTVRRVALDSAAQHHASTSRAPAASRTVHGALGRRRERPRRPDPAPARADRGRHARRQRLLVPRQRRASRSTTGATTRRGRRACRPASAG